MAELSPRAQAILQTQKRRYLANLDAKGRELASLWGQTGKEGLGEFLDAVHRLAGSAGLHGLDEIQQSAARIEQRLKAHHGEAREYDSEVRALIDQLMSHGGPG